ncbi:MAG: DoxX family protein [Polaromonas sp.]|uniref:DoxX family protein n=1 Tax=Polaromonas sp. TaxID=1869339 RepID=UPI00403720B8
MNRHPAPSSPRKAERAGLALVFLWFLLGGLAHFVFTEAEMSIVPPWMPWPREAVLISGVAELLGAVGLLWRPVRRAALWGLFVLTIAVTPAHIYMLQQPALFPSVPYWALLLRLPIQAALLALIAWLALRPAAVSGR